MGASLGSHCHRLPPRFTGLLGEISQKNGKDFPTFPIIPAFAISVEWTSVADKLAETCSPAGGRWPCCQQGIDRTMQMDTLSSLTEGDISARSPNEAAGPCAVDSPCGIQAPLTPSRSG
jgi:hypothetical protein